jgi:hypothetical protein
MKEIRITLDDEDFNMVEKRKGDLTWREFLLKAKV